MNVYNIALPKSRGCNKLIIVPQRVKKDSYIQNSAQGRGEYVGFVFLWLIEWISNNFPLVHIILVHQVEFSAIKSLMVMTFKTKTNMGGMTLSCQMELQVFSVHLITYRVI